MFQIILVLLGLQFPNSGTISQSNNNGQTEVSPQQNNPDEDTGGETQLLPKK